MIEVGWKKKRGEKKQTSSYNQKKKKKREFVNFAVYKKLLPGVIVAHLIATLYLK